MNLAKLNRTLEIFWWWMAGITFVMVVIFSITDGLDKWSFFFLAPLIAVLAALVRRFAAKKLAKSQAFRDEQAKNN
ncbi:MAG: hypothetical protein HYZ14_15685 [Bacteroidetes bacterium]|nr:hypothetical protein [Bacteroidota bacterium]